MVPISTNSLNGCPIVLVVIALKPSLGTVFKENVMVGAERVIAGAVVGGGGVGGGVGVLQLNRIKIATSAVFYIPIS